jgi:hypothetical protein
VLIRPPNWRVSRTALLGSLGVNLGRGHRALHRHGIDIGILPPPNEERPIGVDFDADLRIFDGLAPEFGFDVEAELNGRQTAP